MKFGEGRQEHYDRVAQMPPPVAPFPIPLFELEEVSCRLCRGAGQMQDSLQRPVGADRIRCGQCGGQGKVYRVR